MSACECCWKDSRFAELMGEQAGDAYHRVLGEHEKRHCPCTDYSSTEGARLRAGQWWDEALQRDRRCEVKP